MKLDPSLQPVLLALADADLAASSTPTATADDQAEAPASALAKARDQLTQARLALADLQLQLNKIDEDLAKLDRRKVADRRELGATTDVETRRDLTHDLASAERRSGELKAERDSVAQAIAAAQADEAARSQAVAQQEALVADIAPTTSDADEAAPVTVDPRPELRDQLPADVLATYDRQAAESGAGAARFTGQSCENCSIRLSPGDIADIVATPADELPQCPECGTYLVRA